MTALRVLGAVLLAALAVGAVRAIGLVHEFLPTGRWTLTDPLLPSYTPEVALWAFAGTLAAAFATAALVLAAGTPLGAWWVAMTRAGDDRVRIGAVSALTLVLGVGAHVGLAGAPTLAGVASAAFAGATVPAVAWIGGRWAGPRAGVLAAVLFAAAPMVLLAHHGLTAATIATFVTAWAVVAVERARDADAPRGIDVALGGLAAVGVAVDPPVGAGVAAALTAVWGWDRRGDPRAPGRAALAAGAAAVVLAVLVAASATAPTMGAGRDFAVEAWRPVVTPLVAVARIAIEALGWPLALVPVWFAGTPRARGVCAALGAAVIGPQVLVTNLDPGAYGPERLQVLVLPVVWLTVAGLEAVRGWSESPAWARVVAAATAASIGVAAFGYVPLRAAALDLPHQRADEEAPSYEQPDDEAPLDDVPDDEPPDEAPPPIEPAP